MKKIIIALLACLPLTAVAQNTWEVPQDETQQTKAKAKKEAKAKAKANDEDAKYLAGAVPMIDGKIVFTLDKNVPGMSADTIYQRMFNLMTAMTKEPNQLPQSRIAVVNKGEHTIAARMKEWLVFQNSFLSLDRTEFNYTLVAKASDGHITVTMERLSYEYEKNRTDVRNATVTKAEDWISDDEALNKSKTKLLKYTAKFRRKTIDRKDNIFGQICQTLGIEY